MTRLVAIMVGAALVAGCGPRSPEEVRAHKIAKCERQFGRIAPDPAGGEALCTCMTDRLEAEGLEITDMLGGDRARVEEIGRACGQEAGIEMPGM